MRGRIHLRFLVFHPAKGRHIEERLPAGKPARDTDILSYDDNADTRIASFGYFDATPIPRAFLPYIHRSRTFIPDPQPADARNGVP